ncbi:hypothetical protein [Erysipelothrix anatis]|uniref:hypothetical protein n=1 Tax=Erysipelothrix anatis TaxID=2683713 RepID=UPI0013599641|nr:hypothetical protein [Erysipelothrix anatis]
MYEKLVEYLETNTESRNAQDELARLFGFTQATASRKLNNLIEFKSSEIRLFKKHYNLSANEVTELFEL